MCRLIWLSGQPSICNQVVASSSSLSSVHCAPGHIVNATEFNIWHIYWHTFPIDVHQVVLACGTYVAFEGHILLLAHICRGMVNECCILMIFDEHVQ